MSKLSDAMRRVQRTESTPMGFGAARNAPKATLLVGVITSSSGVPAAIEKGAEVVIIDARSGGLKAGDVSATSTASVPVGAWLATTTRDDATALQKAGLDFIAFGPESMPAEVLLAENLGFALALPAAPGELFLRSLEALALDALWLSALPSPLTVLGQLELNKIGMLGRRPLICEVPRSSSMSDIECLRAAGAALLLAGSPDEIAELKEKVAKLPPRRQRKEERPTVALPRQQAMSEEDDDEE